MLSLWNSWTLCLGMSQEEMLKVDLEIIITYSDCLCAVIADLKPGGSLLSVNVRLVFARDRP